ncbi:hypothetical protein Tco_1110099 [Tanacetum coccineum]|uniref:Uncharacterized protein n=1 Tax=Tanacetum coccineum TaxID=301880 RepID=A0ABQ5II99_9ASTR
MRPQLWNCKVHKGITAVGIRYKQYGEDYDGYFPSELNGIVGEKLLFRFHYTDYNINNNNHVYQVQRISHDEAIINVFKKDFISELKQIGDNIPFNIEETLNSGQGNKSSRSRKRTIIDLEEYNEPDEEAKRGKKIVHVKVEPKE